MIMIRTTIVIADDHPILRQGLRTLLEGEPDFDVVGEAGDGAGSVAVVEKQRPDVLVLDVVLPGFGGFEVARRVAECAPSTRTLMLSMHANEAYIAEALRAGATGYAAKETGPAELVKAVREVAAGRLYLSPPFSERAVAAYLGKLGPCADPYATLTPRETEILALAAEGLNNPRIAARLNISVRTVETHRAHLLKKLGLQGQHDLVRYALKRGIVQLL
jgi:two-component system, NarL family, response regulator NreC